MIFDQSAATAKLKCPICSGPVELVEQGVQNWRVSCLKNDFIEDDASPMPCAFEDVYGETPLEAITNFKAMAQPVQPEPTTGNWTAPENGEKALYLACYFQNQVCELEEIIELFCLDAEAAQPAQAVKAEPLQVTNGWKLVPIEPTQEMISAMATAWQQAVATDNPNECVAEYHAMLAVAPQPRPPVAQAEQESHESCPHGDEYLIRDCLRCGAPKCCGKCCAEESIAQVAQAEPLSAGWTDEQISKAARALSDQCADTCGIDKEEHWTDYRQGWIDDVRAILKAVTSTPAGVQK